MKNKGFTGYGITDEVLNALKILGYQEPTPIQQQVIPVAMKGLDVVGKSQTGSGKTAAFAIPLCEKADWEENLPESLVLEPTRELTVQVKQEIFNIGRNKRLKIVDAFGGFPIDKQMLSLKQKTHIVVGTPGRIMDHIRRESLKLSKIKRVVIDEADLMLDMGFTQEVMDILNQVKREGMLEQIMLFSATMNHTLDEIVSKYMNDPQIIEIESEHETVDTVEQECYQVDDEEKYHAFKMLLMANNPTKSMIFCGTRQMVDVLCRKLARDGIQCGMIHGEIEQRDRIRTIERFKEGSFRYLIATDVAARGIDVSDLSHVFNYDFPTGRETYVHRIGRTGRNGQSGKAVSIVCPSDEKMLHMVEDYIGQQIPKCEIDDVIVDEKAFAARQKEKVKKVPKKGAGFDKTIKRLSIGGGKKSKMRAGDIVGTLCSIDGMTADDIGIIDVRDSLVYVEVLNGKGPQVLKALQTKTIKGKVRKVREVRI